MIRHDTKFTKPVRGYIELQSTLMYVVNQNNNRILVFDLSGGIRFYVFD